MRVEFLDPEATRARITRGWFRKREAIVERKHSRLWVFEDTRVKVFHYWRGDLCPALEHRREKFLHDLPWKPVGRAKLPKARLLP